MIAAPGRPTLPRMLADPDHRAPADPDLSPPAADLHHALAVATELGQAAAAEIARIYAEGFEVHHKADGSPVTRADAAAEALIVAGLRAAFPADAVLGEETGRSGPPDAARVWLVDPLDGTADFAGRTDDFCAMIGLCVGGRPVLGVLAAPALGRTWIGLVGHGAFELDAQGRRRAVRLAEPMLEVRFGQTEPLHFVQSRSHPPAGLAERLAARLGAPARLTRRGSVGVKVGLVIAGEAHGYLHPQAGTSLWDCAGPEAVMVAAGGVFTQPDGQPIDYAAACDAAAVRAGRHPDNPAGILAGPPGLCARLVA